MDTPRPANPAAATALEPGPREASELSFLLGPPAQGQAADLIAESAARHAVDPDAVWIEMIRDAVRLLLEPGADGRSRLDSILSEALGEPVTVWGVHGLEHFQAGRRIPGLSIETASILDLRGRPVARDLGDRELRRRVARALMDLTHAEWVSATAAFGADELGFPNLGPAGKEA